MKQIISISFFLFLITSVYGQNPFTHGNVIGIQSDNGAWLARCSGCQNTTNANTLSNSATFHIKGSAASLSRYAKFTVVNAGNGKIALKADNGKYLGRCSGCVKGSHIKNTVFVHLSNYSRPYAKFTPVKLGNGRYGLKTDINTYLARCVGCSPGKNIQILSAHAANTSKPSYQFKVTVLSKSTTKPIVSKPSNGFLVMINGIQCIQAADFGDKIDEVYVDVFIDGAYKKTIGPKTMKPAPKGIWQNSWEGMFEKNSQEAAKWLFAARQEYWMMPGTFYANSSVRFDLWEKDGGKRAAIDPDDKIGSVTIKKSDMDGNYKESSFNKGGESGRWRMVCTKLTRTDYSTVSNDSRVTKITIPIKNQGNEGACVAFATTAALGMAYLKKRGISYSNEDLFDGFALYNQRSSIWKGKDSKGKEKSGWRYEYNGQGALDHLLLHPIPLKANPNSKVQLKNYYVYKKNGEVLKYYVSNGRVTYVVAEKANNDGLNKMRAQIKKGNALLTRYDCYNDFNTYVNYSGMYGGRVSSSKQKISGHAVMVYGYSNPRKGENNFPAWYIQNSWGPKWGKNGKFTFASGAVGIDENMYLIGDIEIIGATSTTSVNTRKPQLKKFYFKNTSDWTSKFAVTYKVNGLTKKWNTGELRKGQSKMLQVYDNWTIISVKVKYKDITTWKVLKTQPYNKEARYLPPNYKISGRIGSSPKFGS